MSAVDDEARAEGACCAAHRRNNGRPVRAEIAAYRAEEDALSSELARALAAESDARVALVIASEQVKVVSERFQLFRKGDEDRRDPNREPATTPSPHCALHDVAVANCDPCMKASRDFNRWLDDESWIGTVRRIVRQEITKALRR